MIVSKCIVLAAAIALSVAVPKFVERMEILTEEISVEIKEGQIYDLELFKYLRNNFKSTNTSLLGSFKWQDCGSSSELIHINGLSLTPDPLKLPGNLGIKFDVNFKGTVNAPLKAEIKIEKHESFIWVPIPCIDGVGSCTYDDLCDKLAGITCPPVFDDHHIPCKCPFPQGHYSLPSSTFMADVHNIPSGDYYLKANLDYQSKQAICIEIYFSVD